MSTSPRITEHLVAAEPGQRPVDGPVEHRVQRAEVVRLAATVVWSPVAVPCAAGAAARCRPSVVVASMSLLAHPPCVQVVLRQDSQALPPDRRGGTSSARSSARCSRPADAAAARAGRGSGNAACSASSQEVDVVGEQALARRRTAGSPAATLARVELGEERVEVGAGRADARRRGSGRRRRATAARRGRRGSRPPRADVVLAHQRGDVAEARCAPRPPSRAAATARAGRRRSARRRWSRISARSAAGASARSGRCGRCAARCGSGSTGCRSGSRWWHCACRFTPSEATSPVTSTRTGEVSSLKPRRSPAARRRSGRRAASRRRRRRRPSRGGQLAAQPVQGGDPLGEHHGPGRDALADADLLEVVDQRVELAEPASCQRCGVSSSSAVERLRSLAVCGSPVCSSLAPALLDRLGAARPARTGTPWPVSTGRAPFVSPEYGDAARRRVQPGRRQLVGDGVLGRRAPRPARWPAPARSAQSLPDLGGHLGAVPVAADEQVLDVLLRRSLPSAMTAVGSSSSDQLGERLRLRRCAGWPRPGSAPRCSGRGAGQFVVLGRRRW